MKMDRFVVKRPRSNVFQSNEPSTNDKMFSINQPSQSEFLGTDINFGKTQ